MITVYYDGKCGLCSREIKHYKKIAEENIFNWVDLIEDDSDFLSAGYKKSDGLKLLHAKDSNGNFQIGVDAFLVIWKNLKFWKILYYVVSLPIIYHIAKFTYLKFANWRFNKLEHCKLSIREESK